MTIIFVPCLPKLVGRRYNFPKILADMGHDVYSVTWEVPFQLTHTEKLQHIKTSLKTGAYDHDNIHIRKFGRLPFFWPYINGILFKRQINQLFKEVGADIIVSQSYTNEVPIPKKLPLIYDLLDDQAAMAEIYGSAIYRLAFRLLGVKSIIKRQCRNALAVIVVSKSMYDFAKPYNKYVYEIPNGVNKRLIKEVQKLGLDHDVNPYSLIYVSGFNQWSRASETIESVVELRKEFPKLELTLIGDGTETEKMKTAIEKHHAESYIHCLGAIYNQQEVYKVISAHHIGLSMSEKNKLRDAASPVKVFEYTGFGKKVVSTNLAEIERIALPNVHIFRYDGRNSMKQAIKKALLDDKDYSDTKEIVLKDYAWENLTKQLHGIIQDTLAP